MSEPTREEFDAKLATVEARLDGKLASIEGKLDRLFDRVDVSISYSKEAKEAADNARNVASSIKWNVAIIAITIAIGLVAVAAFWVQGIEMISGLFESIPKTK